MGTISIYLRDSVLRKLDEAVERQAANDRVNGLDGRQVTNRSQMIERIVEDYLSVSDSTDIETIRYYVVPLAEEFGAAKVSLFGSFARGDSQEASDVDILLDKGAIKGLQVLDFQDELARRLGKPVDVVTTAGASEHFLEKIKQDEVLLYEAI